MDEAKPQDARINVEAVEGHGRVTLVNWRNALGTSTRKPMEVASLATGERVVVMIWHAQAGTTGKLDLQFMLEPKP